MTHLIDSSTSLDGHAVLKAAVAFWQANRVLRKPVCIACKTSLAGYDIEVGAYLFATSPGSPGIASVSALCCACWHGLPAD